AAPAGKIRVCLAARFLGRIVEAVGIRLPDLHQDVFENRAGAVEDAYLDVDALAARLVIDHLASEVDRKNAFYAEEIGCQPDMHVGSCRLRRAFLQPVEFLGHDQLPSLRFSNSVELLPRKTMSNL